MSYHKQKGTCAACGYPAARTRKCKNYIILDNWSYKVQQRKGTGTGRMRYLKTIPRVYKNQMKGIAKWLIVYDYYLKALLYFY